MYQLLWSIPDRNIYNIFHNNNPRHKYQQSYQKSVKSQISRTKGNDGSTKNNREC